MTPEMTIPEVLALIDTAAAVITGDTFALQAASALKRPSLSFFGPTNPYRNGPINPLDKTAFHQRECSFCYRRSCRNPRCLEDITPEEMADLFNQLWKRNDE